MGFFDKTKNQLQSRFKGFGEETVRVMDEAQEDPKPKKQREPKPKKEPAPKKVVKKEIPEKRNRIVTEPEPEPIVEEPEMDFDLPEDEPEETNVFAVEPEPEPEEKEETPAFEMDKDTSGFFANMTQKHKKRMKEYESVPVPKIDEGKVQDILEILNIPPTFEISQDIFLPDDLVDIDFNLQVPQGYEMGEVDSFVSRTKISIDKLVSLLTLRNEHVAKLATVVDRLQVDISNIRLQSEVANGINIMTTNDDDELEKENVELKLIIKDLESQLRNNGQVSTVDESLSDEEREKYDILQDELSVKERTIESLENTIYDLKNRLAVAEENDEYESYTDDVISDFDIGNDEEDANDDYSNSLQNYVEHIEKIPEERDDEILFSDDDNDDAYYVSTTNDSFTLPEEDDTQYPDFMNHSDDSDEDFSLPDFEEDDSDKSSAFFDDDESLDNFMVRNQHHFSHAGEPEQSSMEMLDDNGNAISVESFGTYYNADEDELDDELDRLQNWNK